MPRPPPIVTVLTDFGQRDNYVGVMKGVILSRCRAAQLVDISHELPPQDVAVGAFLLEHSAGHFPAGTVHLVVVDPGVGTERRGLVAVAGGHCFVAPDNGVLTPVLRADPQARIHRIDDTSLFHRAPSRTFHGRDIFSPVAGAIAAGLPPERAGARIEDPELLSLPPPELGTGRLDGHIIYVDHFGNLITDLPEDAVAALAARGPVRVELEDGTTINGLAESYQTVAPGSLLAVIGGFDRLEVAARDADARASTGLDVGARVTLVAAV